MDSLRIGICDDEAEDLSQVMEMVSRYDESKQLHIASFLHASDLLLAFKQSPFDIVILDIEMEPPTGFDIAKVLVSLESPPVVIFATKSNAYALKGYGVAIRYLQKPICQPEFFEAMDAAKKHNGHVSAEQENGVFTLSLRLADCVPATTNMRTLSQ